MCWLCARLFALQKDTAYCSACSKNEFLEAYKSCWMRWKAQGRNDGRDREEGGCYTLEEGLSGSHLQAWLNNRMLYENKNIICLFKRARKGPLIGFPKSPLWWKNPPPFLSSKHGEFVQEAWSLSSCCTVITTKGMCQDTIRPTKRLPFPLRGSFTPAEFLGWGQDEQ